jgi:hypothetical protein
MTTTNPGTIPLHPDDVLFFSEVAATMRQVAKQYRLQLRNVVGLPMPESSMSDRLGDCGHDGVIRLVMRATVDGAWCDEPRSPEEIWKTAAHELAHLRHFQHGISHNEFTQELTQALDNIRARGDHKQKVIGKLLKMREVRDGEAKPGNTAAAEAFAAAINKMLIEHELNPSDLDYARAQDDDPVVEVEVNREQYGIERKKRRFAWQESLARRVANAHLCTFLIRTGTNDIIFVGTRRHATIAEYAYGVLVRSASEMCEDAYHQYGLECGRARGLTKWVAGEPGFCESWLASFVQRIGERLDSARKEAVKEATADVPGGESQALMRLDGQLVKVRQYIDDKFKSKRGASALSYTHSGNAAGRSAGRAAADAMAIGRKGITSGARKLLT